MLLENYSWPVGRWAVVGHGRTCAPQAKWRPYAHPSSSRTPRPAPVSQPGPAGEQRASKPISSSSPSNGQCYVYFYYLQISPKLSWNCLARSQFTKALQLPLQLPLNQRLFATAKLLGKQRPDRLKIAARSFLAASPIAS